MRSGVVRMAGCVGQNRVYGAGSHSGTDGSGLSGKLLFLTCGIVHEADPPAAHDLFRGHRRMDSAEAGIRNQADTGDCGDYHYSPRHLRFAAGGLPVLIWNPFEAMNIAVKFIGVFLVFDGVSDLWIFSRARRVTKIIRDAVENGMDGSLYGDDDIID